MPLPFATPPLLPDAAPLELLELELLPPELLLPEPEPPLLLLVERKGPLLPPEPAPDEPLLTDPLPELPLEVLVPLVDPLPEPLLLVVPPLEVPVAGFLTEAVPVPVGGGWFQGVDELDAGPEHSQAPPASAAATHGAIHPVFLIFTSSNRQDL